MIKKSLAFLLLLNFAAFVFSEFPQIEAKKYYKEKDLMIFEGDVTISVGNIKIYSNKTTLNIKTRVGEIIGKVSIAGEDFFINASKTTYSLKDRTFTAYDVYASIKPEITMIAKKVEKKKGDKFIFHSGYFTTCIQCNPRWHITMKKAVLVRKDHIEIISALFKFKNIPAFYLPYFYYPISSKKRKTGFLMPQIGYSTFKGYLMKESFFWAIKDNMDLTLSGEYYSLFGKGVGGIFRSGDAYGNFLNISATYLGNENTKNYIIKGEGKINFSRTFSLSLNMNLNSGLDFIQNFSENLNFALRRNFYSNIYIKKTIGNFTLSFLADQSETFYSYTTRNMKIRHLPAIDVSLYKTEIFRKVLYISLKTGIKNSSRLYGEEWLTVPKLYFSPTTTLNLKPFPWLTLNTEYTINNYYYLKSYKENTKTVSDENLYLNQHNLKASLIGPVFFRIYDVGLNGFIYKLKHTIEPSFNYRFVSDMENRSRIIPIEWTDYFFFFHQLDFTFTNRFYAKKDRDSSAEEILNFGFSQSYYFNPEKQRLYFIPPPDLKTPIKWSERNYFLRFVPTQYTYLSFNATYNQYYHSFRNLSIALNLNDKDRLYNLNFSYSKLQYLRPDNVSAKMDFLRGALSLKPVFLPLEVVGNIDYNLATKTLYNFSILTKLKFQCLNFMLQYRKVGYRTTGVDSQILFSIGLGTITPSPEIFAGKGTGY